MKKAQVEFQGMVVSVLIIALLIIVGVVIFSHVGKSGAGLFDTVSAFRTNISLVGSLGVPLSMGSDEKCGTTWVVNGSVGRWDTDPVTFSFSALEGVERVSDCTLFGNWSASGWIANESLVNLGEFNPTVEFNITLPISNQAYIWSVTCNNTANVVSSTSNQTFLMTQGVLA